MIRSTIVVLIFGLGLSSCSPSPEQLTAVLEKHPEILTNAIQKNPKQFVEAYRTALIDARKGRGNTQQARGPELREEEFKNPKKPELTKTRVSYGRTSAPITIVGYTDYQCPFCTKGHKTMKELQAKYGDKIRIVWKHLPLAFHKEAMPAARYYEAVALQSHEKAKEFHEKLFENQSKIGSEKEQFLQAAAKEVGVNMVRLLKDVKSAEIQKIIDRDMAEAQKFGFRGTPGFLVNGVSVRGAYPAEEFSKIIDRHLKNGA